MNIHHLIKTVSDLKSISSTNEKKKFLEEHRNDEEFIHLLKFLLDARKITGISKAKLNKNISTKYLGNVARLNNMDELYLYFTYNNTGTDTDIFACQHMIEEHAETDEEKKFIGDIITKSLKLGIDVKLVNSVYGKGFIPVHEVQLGSPRDKLRLKNGEEFWLTQKLNGTRATYINDKLISRQGIEFKGLEHIIEEFNDFGLRGIKDYIFDGELIRKNIDGVSDNENFTIGTGIINSDEGDKSCIEFVVFDIIDKNDFEDKDNKFPPASENYALRRRHMDDLNFLVRDRWKNIRILPVLYHGSDPNMIDHYLEYAESMGWEGLMLNKNAPYVCKRTTDLIKIKKFKYSDLRIVGYEEGTNKYEGMLGAVIVDYKGNTVNVGSGFTDEQREEYWKIREELIGKIVEVKYKDVTKDKKTGLESLQFPIFQRIREDKIEESLE